MTPNITMKNWHKLLGGDLDVIRRVLGKHRSEWVQDQMEIRDRPSAHATIGELPPAIQEEIFTAFQEGLKKFEKQDIRVSSGLPAKELEKAIARYEQRVQAMGEELVEAVARQAHIWFGTHPRGISASGLTERAANESQKFGWPDWKTSLREKVATTIHTNVTRMAVEMEFATRVAGELAERRPAGLVVFTPHAAEEPLKEGLLQKLSHMHWAGKLALVGSVAAMGAVMYGVSHRKAVETDRKAVSAQTQLG
jgi:hypothetical protein